MPRYAKGSLEKALYDDILEFAETDSTPKSVFDEQVKHHLSSAFRQDKVRAIRSMVRMQELGLVTEENFLLVIADILQE